MGRRGCGPGGTGRRGEGDRQRTRLGQTSRVQRQDGRTGAEGRSANINCFRKSLYNVLTVTVGRNLGLLITLFVPSAHKAKHAAALLDLTGDAQQVDVQSSDLPGRLHGGGRSIHRDTCLKVTSA